MASLSLSVTVLYKVYIVDQEECAGLAADVLEAIAGLPADILEAGAELVGCSYTDANTILCKSSITPRGMPRSSLPTLKKASASRYADVPKRALSLSTALCGCTLLC